ncbi:hypothetical protein A5320_18210 [Rheinheimera sp. SA_1]|uniref:ABC transporter ATP-binding protein n=1 Tax=Rheinheimera sp. SA_1 TaxID=1827365 RepID=UPI0007FFC692|nr:ABC transporter ATP-binding protein [Rheinheimera sp. SA_1]OBP13483.1 hypothetical protein A5320_18210 [Rheinheimera sp. SA_1]
MQHLTEGLIVIKNLTHRYNAQQCALNDVNLTIGRGVFGLLGANGAGKSTLIRILCTMMSPTAGEVSICNYDLRQHRDQVRQLIGYLPQDFGAWPSQTVTEVIDTLAMLAGIKHKAERQRRIEWVLAAVGLDGVAGRKIKQLSGGMLRRVGVAQALVHDPKILIMDEPTVGLDPEERQRFRQLMTELAADRAIILSTHIVSDLGSACSDMALIHRGKLEFRGTPADLIAAAAGEVFELVCDAAGEVALTEQFEIVSRSRLGAADVLRGVVRQGNAPAGAVVAGDITLEEAYLAFAMKKERAVLQS